MTTKTFDELSDFGMAIYYMILDDGYGEAIYKQDLTNEQRERFEKIKEIYLEECLKDCKF